VTWNGALFAGALLLSGWGAVRLPPVPDFDRIVLPQDLPVMEWIKAHVPENEKIAGRGYFHSWFILEYDAIVWVPYFTRHLTNQTLLAASMEKAPIADREKARSFTAEMYRRDMSTPESAAWMQEQGYRWFYSGANAPIVHAVPFVWTESERKKLLDQIARNPTLELVFTQGAARLYRVK
jgi:hypothetical protein